MSREKQNSGCCENCNSHIEEMAKDICQSDYCNTEWHSRCRHGENSFCWDVEILAKKLYNAGYRKQSEGKWITEDTILGKCCTCSVCGGCPTMEYRYCPYCGAKMKGGAE